MTNDDSKTIGSANDRDIGINETSLAQNFNNNRHILRFLAGHELSHAYFEDDSWDDTLEEAIGNMKNKTKQYPLLKKCLDCIYRFEEVRADISSAFDSASARKGYQLWTEQDLKLSKDDSKITSHPSMKDRLLLSSYIEKLITINFNKKRGV